MIIINKNAGQNIYVTEPKEWKDISNLFRKYFVQL